MNLRFTMGLVGSKAAKLGLTLLRRQGSYLPGAVATKLDPDYLKHLPKPSKVVAVTGTNGKTTTSNLILDVLATKPERVVNNRLGSNTKPGIISALTENLNLAGRKKADLAVLEVDELWTKIIFKEVEPDYLLITNLFQDSIPRNAHTDYIVDNIEMGIPASSRLILNADDLISSRIAPDNQRVYFSVAPLARELERRDSRLQDLSRCPACQGELEWSFLRYHHLGRAKCLTCGLTNPQADYEVTDADEQTMTVREASGSYRLPILSPSRETIYNQVAAYAVLREMGLSPEEIRNAMASMDVVSSRYHQIKAGDKTITMISAKGMNPIANSRVFDYVAQETKDFSVIISNDNSGHGIYTEILAWLYDADFEYLAKDNLKQLIINSWKAEDIKLRALLAGIPEEKIKLTANYEEVPDLLDLDGIEDIYILHDIEELSLKKVAFYQDKILEKLEDK